MTSATGRRPGTAPRGRRGLWMALALGLGVTACGGQTTPSADAANDKLAQILARGTIVLSTDLEYPPQSFAIEGADRVAETRCAANQLTATEVGGFDVDTATAVAEQLGVEPCFVTPNWTEVISGGWGDRWDIAFGSVNITTERMAALSFTQPYYADAAYFYVHEDSAVTDARDLDGMRVGACASCIHEAYLNGSLELPGGQALEFQLTDPVTVVYDYEGPGLDALAEGDGVNLDAFLAQEPVGEQAIADGLPLRRLDPPPFYAYSAGAVDQSSRAEQGPFIARINEIVAALHADGTLRSLSMNYYDHDYTAEAAAFDVSSLLGGE